MKRKIKIFVTFFPVILVAFQVLVNILSFVSYETYAKWGFYLNTFFGTNVLFAIFLLLFTWLFQFCAVSRWAAIAELLFAVNYMIVKQDNLYNILFQVIVGTIAILLTFRHYIKKYPLCRISLLLTFIGSVVSKCSCSKGIDKWQNDIRRTVIKDHYANSHKYK